MALSSNTAPSGTAVQSRGKPPLSRRVQRRVMSAANVPMRVMLRLPFHTPMSRRLMLAYIIGRKSGRTYRQPLSYVRDGDTLLTPGGGAWKLNLKRGTPVRIRLDGREVTADPELVRDPAAVEALLARIIEVNPTAGRFVGVQQSPDGRLDPERLGRAIEYGFCIVRWHLDETAAGKAAAGPA
ncbi:MAG TPA: nitroreductase/quinone reductase family protein [Actinocrinis sp.]|jgi:hypothetical protein